MLSAGTPATEEILEAEPVDVCEPCSPIEITDPVEGSEVTLEQVPTTEKAIKAVLDTLVFVPGEGIFYEVFRGVCPLTNIDTLEVARINITI